MNSAGLRAEDGEAQAYLRCSIVAGAAVAACAGKLMSTRVPTFGVLVISSFPPMISAMRRATVRPRPSPEKVLTEELSA